jgi:hypothetical protein
MELSRAQYNAVVIASEHRVATALDIFYRHLAHEVFTCGFSFGQRLHIRFRRFLFTRPELTLEFFIPSTCSLRSFLNDLFSVN